MMPDTHDPETGEVLDSTPATTGQRAIPHIRTLDQIVARANGGEYRDVMPDIIRDFFLALFRHAREHGVIAKGKLEIAFPVEVDRYGEVGFAIKPKITLPAPPAEEGAGSAYIDEHFNLMTNPQTEAPLLRDVGRRGQKMRDRT